MADVAVDARQMKAKRTWLKVGVVGFVMVLLTLLTVALVILDKPHFGRLVNWAFLPVITSGVIVGGLILFVAALMQPERKSWRGITLIVWSLIAVTSPLFGIMFLFPWGLLAASTPMIIWIFRTLFVK
jgi:hypothetical protein